MYYLSTVYVLFANVTVNIWETRRGLGVSDILIDFNCVVSA